jgi:hypothetical protein
MTNIHLDRRLVELEALRYRFGSGEADRVVKLLARLVAVHFRTPTSLIRFHEALLFLRAFPHGPTVLRAVVRILNGFHKKVEALREAGTDMKQFDTFEVSGIAGTVMEDTLSFDVARWLIHEKSLIGKVEIAWDHYEPGRELGSVAPRFIPLLEDDAYVEADTPWRKWIEAASGVPGNERGNVRRNAWRSGSQKKIVSPEWLIARFEQLQLPPQQKAELYESLCLPLRWNLANSAISRTRNSTPDRDIFYHDQPLISRSQVSLAAELARPSPILKKLSRQRGAEVVELIREVMLVRYRELYGTTLGDPNSVVRANVGRGVTIYLWNLPADRRLPLRAYVAGVTLKNGVPINYIEAIGLCEWMEVGFNTFYTFRGGEAGWIYAQILRCVCHLMGTTSVSVYPYQLGHDNEEAIDSGAFWFYRKLGFVPGRPDLQKLAEREELKIAAATEIGKEKNRTPARTLKRLASGHVFYELPGSQRLQNEAGAWAGFSTRNIGLRVNQRMARDFGGNAVAMRTRSKRTLERLLGVNTSSWTALEKAAFENFALVVAESPGARSRAWTRRAWTQNEKEDLIRVIRAKAKPDEMLYLRLTQRHGRLREALLTLGSTVEREAKREDER